MKALLIKEIRSYLSSIIGYAAIIVFLIATGFFVWVFPGNNNIIEMGEASLQPFFSQAPGILIFLLPAFTMRCFAEENKSGTIELLATKPITLTKKNTIDGKEPVEITITSPTTLVSQEPGESPLKE